MKDKPPAQSKKRRLLYFAWTPPSRLSGATLAMRRHLLEHDDFEVFVATSGEFEEPGVKSYHLGNPAWLDRIGRTRFWRVVRNIEMLFFGGRLPADLVEAAREFKPEVILTVVDLTISKGAFRLAEKLGIPVITNFQDWWPRGQFYYPQERPYSFLVPFFERRFRRYFKSSDLVFCTSEGMKEFLGPHPNSHVLYPIGSNVPIEDQVPPEEAVSPGKRRLIYTGTAFGLYGRMLRDLALAMEGHPDWELVIYGKRPDWPEAELKKAESSGLYRGFLPFEKLQGELRKAHACLSVMSFDPSLEVMMRTSFTTKVLDYCSAGRPVIMWGPGYCSPVRLIKRRQAGLAVERPDADGVLEALKELDNEHTRQVLSVAALKLAKEELSHSSIHKIFVSEVNRLIRRTCKNTY
jgi:glycosyltransferase involved in cell wall biosynthesis